MSNAGVVFDSLKDVENAASRQAGKAIKSARESVKAAAKSVAPVAASPLFGNGLHTALADAKEAADALDERLEKIEQALHRHFNGSES